MKVTDEQLRKFVGKLYMRNYGRIDIRIFMAELQMRFYRNDEDAEDLYHRCVGLGFIEKVHAGNVYLTKKNLGI